MKLKGQTDSILKEALILSESTRSQIDEMQRSLYVKSQLLTCYAYRRKKDYAAAYLLAMELMKSKLTETERAQVNEAYAYNGYFFATTFARQDSTGHADYAQARALCEEVLPYAPAYLKAYIEPKIPLHWYLEAAQNHRDQKYEEALTAYGHAREGFAALGIYSNEVKTICNIAYIKTMFMCKDEARQLYAQALAQSRQHGLDSMQMAVLIDTWKFGKNVGDLPLMRASATSMDSLAEITVRPA